MEWQDKTKLVQLGNKIYKSKEAREEFQKYVLDNIDSFDSQAWDMFINIVKIDLEEMEDDTQFWKKVYPHLVSIDISTLGFRAEIRHVSLTAICEYELKINET